MTIGTLPPPAERPAYTIAEASRYARTANSTTRRWVRGYEYATLQGRRQQGPVGRHRASERFLTFYDLVEVAAIAAAVREGIKIPRIRAAVDYAQDLLLHDRPLLLERFLTDGRDLFLREARPEGTLHIINASRAGQEAFPFIAEVLRNLVYEDGKPSQWWPLTPERPVVVDPRIGFGQPVLAPSGVRTETIVDRFAADEPVEAIAEEYGLTTAEILEALRFENRPGVIAA